MINLACVDDGGKPSLAGVACERCGGVGLIWWGWSRPRKVRFAFERFAPPQMVRCRRVRCKECGATGTVLPGGVVARRKDAARVVLAALAARADGLGFRMAAELVDRAFSTVRNWFTAASRDVEWVAALRVSVAGPV